MPSLAELTANLPKRTIVIASLVVVSLIVGSLILSSVYSKLKSARAAAEEEATQAVADKLARQLGAVLEPQRLRLAALAEEQKIVAALSATKSIRDQTASEVQASIPGALLLRLLPRGADHIDPNSTPPLTFASVDMLHKAASSDTPVNAELHLGGSDNSHVVMIQRVPRSGEPIGFLHLSVAPATIREAEALGSANGIVGHVEVRQRLAKGAPMIIAKAGNAAAADSTAVLAPIDGTAWEVAYRPASAGPQATGGLPTRIGIALIGVLALGLLAFLGLKRLRGGAGGGADSATYQGAIKAILEGAHPGLEQLLPGKTTDLAVDFGTMSEGLEGDDITQFRGASSSAADGDPTFPDTKGGRIDAGPAAAGIEVVEEAAPGEPVTIDPSIFRSYDIRGIVGETLTVQGIYEIGRALGSEAAARGQQTVVTARDGRNSSQELRDALIEGLRDSGRDVLDIGLTPTPVLYFATHYLDTHSGVMITGSHNPPEYNGLKIVLDGETLSGDAIQAIRTRIETNDFTSGEGTMQSAEIIPDYIRRISEEIPVSLGNALKVVVDCGNSVPGIAAPHILRAIGHDVVELYCEVDGDFPNHHPDPGDPANLQDLIQMVQDEEADLGLAFDGDGDRLGVVDTLGNIIWPDRQMILFARDVLSRNPGAKIIYDVKCSRLLAEDIKKHGGEAIMSRTGHSLIKQKMQETGALLAGEMSGHIFFKERWYGFDDALYCAARLLEILVNAKTSPDEVFAALPGGVATPELKLAMPESEHAPFMEKVIAAANFDDAEKTTIDGLRLDFATSWGLVRPSNTTPCLVLRFEGDDAAALEEVQQRFRDLLLGVDGNLSLPF